MRNFIDSIFNPIFSFFDTVLGFFERLTVADGYSFVVGKLLSPLSWLGSYWLSFFGTLLLLASIYVILMVIISNKSFFISLKDMLKWW